MQEGSLVTHIISNGKLVILAETELTMGDWSGTGYMVLDPDTYTGQYMVDGGLTGELNGGVTSEQVNVAMLVNTIMAIEDIISTYLLCNFLVSVLPLGGPIGVLSIAAVVFITYKLLSMTVCYYMEAVELAERYYEDGDWLAGSDLIDQTELDVAFSIGGWVIGIAGNTALTKRVTESLTEIIGEKAAKKLVKGTKIPTDMKKYVEELIERGFTEDAVRIMAETLEPQSIEKLGRLSKKGLSRRFLECLAENESILKKFDEGQLLLFENSTADPETIVRHLAEEGEDFISRFVKHGDEVFEGGLMSIKPTGTIGDMPKGKYEIPDVNDPRPIERQNQTADLLASKGYVTEMLPYQKNGNGYGVTATSNPDFLIEGLVFDCYSPNTSNARNIRSTIKTKTEKQCSNIILNLDDCPISINDILQAIKNEPIEGLDILLYVKNGKIYQVLGGK